MKHLTFMQSRDVFANASKQQKRNHVKYLQGYNAINSFLLGFRVKERIAAHLFTLYAIVKYKVNKIKGVIFSF